MSNFIILVAIKLNMLYSNNGSVMFMIYPSIDKILNQVGSKYLLVNIVSKRVQELKEKHNYQLKEEEYNSSKDIGRTLEEISKNLIHIEK